MDPDFVSRRRAALLRTLAAFLVAPLAPGLLCWLLFGRFELGFLPGSVVYAGIGSYPVMGLVGVPAYLLITTRGQLAAQHVLGIGTIAGAVAGGVILCKTFEPTCIGLGACSGFAAGVVFWLIWHRHPKARPTL
jgi:hypothetical protein